ncbi:MAG: DUF2914 domain-containing protein [bacterium]
MSQVKYFLIALAGVALLNSTNATAQSETGVAKCAFTTEIVDREPVNDLDSLSSDINKIYFYTDIRNMEGNRVTHRWLHDGQTRAEVSFRIGGPRWRVHSSKKLIPEWIGDWKVEVVDSSGSVIHEDSFVYVKGTSEMTPTPKSEARAEMKTESAAAIPSGDGSITRGVFTTEIVAREPVDEVDSVYTDVKRIFFFTDIRNMQGKTVLHRWVHEGQIRAEIVFEVGGPRWRVYSSKNLAEDWLGNWKVEVFDTEGNLLTTGKFVYLKRE